MRRLIAVLAVALGVPLILFLQHDEPEGCYKNPDCNPDWVNAVIVIAFIVGAIIAVAGYLRFRRNMRE